MNATPDPMLPMPASDRLTALVLYALLAGLVANTLYNICAVVLGWPYPYTTFLYHRSDLFADYFKFILSYPGAASVVIREYFGLSDLLTGYVVDNPYRGVEGLGQPAITHLHVTPFSTLCSLLSLRMMKFIDPVLLFVACLGAMLLYWYRIASLIVDCRRNAIVWLVIGLISYPALMMINRGNLFAGLAGLTIVHAVLIALRGRAPMAAALLLAIAINVRPNAAIFIVPFLAFQWQWRTRAMFSIIVATAGIFVLSLGLSHWLYADYSLSSFLLGLKNYYLVYVIQAVGVPYGSSLFGALAFLFGYGSLLSNLAIVLPGSLYAATVLAYVKGVIDRPTLMFTTCATYCLASTIFADYHLIALLAVPMAIVAQYKKIGISSPNVVHQSCLVASIICLVPKNYAFQFGASYQVVINPAVLFIAMAVVVGCAMASGWSLMASRGSRKSDMVPRISAAPPLEQGCPPLVSSQGRDSGVHQPSAYCIGAAACDRATDRT